MKFKKIMTTFINKLKTAKSIELPTSTSSLHLFKELLIMSIALQLILEILSRRSIPQGLLTTINNPLMFLCSVSLLSTFMSFSLFLPKRHFGYLIISTLWIWLGFTNFILLSYRTTPLTATDFKMISSVFTVIERYLNGLQMISVVILAVLVLLSLVFIGTKLPRTKIVLRKAFVASALSILLLVATFNTALSANAVARNFGNIADAFIDYGFAYSFATSVVDKGIKEPKTYSSENVGAILNSFAMEDSVEVDLTDTPVSTQNEDSIPEQEVEVNNVTELVSNQVPNIIIVQLESFFDVKRLKALDYNLDPTPNLSYLQENFSTGFVTVPSIGAGTVNTEFEILSGMSLDYFGAGEYPYKTILKETTVESLPYDLAELGYESHAFHNNMGTFYARHNVYPNLGFNTFTSIEYMQDVTYNPLDWAKDILLVPEITKALESTTSQDFVFAVSVQPHGKYPEELILENPVIVPQVVSSMPNMINNDTVIETEITNMVEEEAKHLAEDKLLTNDANPALFKKPTSSSTSDVQEDILTDDLTEDASFKIDEGTYNKYLYFVNQIYETDAFIGKLTRTLQDFPEPTIVVFYGDHLPTLDITEDDLKEGTPYQMDYVIWDNMGLEKIDEDLSAYQLSAMVTERLGYHVGLLNRFHQTKKDAPDYQEQLQLLQYDMLYGDRNVYEGVNPFKPTKMTMGIDAVTVTNAYMRGEGAFIKGQNFTPFSEVYADKVRLDTLFIDDTTLIIPNLTLVEGMKIKVSQVTVTNKKLSSTSNWTIDERQLLTY